MTTPHPDVLRFDLAGRAMPGGRAAYVAFLRELDRLSGDRATPAVASALQEGEVSDA